MSKRRVDARSLCFSVLAVVLCVLMPSVPVSAYTNDDYESIYNNTPFYDASTACNGSNGTGGSAVATGNNVKDAYVFFTQNKGLTPVQAAGIIGNLEQESGQGLNPKAQQNGSNSPLPIPNVGFGIAQWTTPDRQQGLLKLGSKEHKDATDLTLQLDYLWQELSTSYSSTLANLKKSTTVEDAVNQFVGPDDLSGNPVSPTDEVQRSGGYEDPGTPVMVNRIKNAQAVLSANGGGTTGGGGSSSSCVTFSGSCTVTSPVYIGEYSQDQLAKIFGDPGTADSHPALHLVTIKEFGFSTEVSPLVAPCLDATVKQIQAENVNYTVRQFGCYRFDSNNGTSTIGLLSYHTYGAACDINWDTNPFVESGAPTAHDMPDQFVQAFKAHGFTWGGSWPQPKDYMHFEWHGVNP